MIDYDANDYAARNDLGLYQLFSFLISTGRLCSFIPKGGLLYQHDSLSCA